MRYPFEWLIDIDKYLPATKQGSSWLSYEQKLSNSRIYLSEATLTGSNPYCQWSGEKKPNFELAMHNFLAETVKFFLEEQQLTTMYSAQENQFKTMTSGITYSMDLSLFRTKDFILSEAGRRDYDARGSTYGPAFSSSFVTQSGALTDYVNETPFDPSYAVYTPPYFYGASHAKISFTPSETKKYTLKEIFAGAITTYSSSYPYLGFNDACSTGSMKL